MSDSLRIGFVGAGQNTRLRHIPGLQAVDGVELYGVCNAHPESTRKVAEDYDIPQQYDSWQELVADEKIDAVVIGTWPNLHCEVTCAALEAGKHVLTEARMARNLDEARQMRAVAGKHPERTAMVVPSPFGLRHGPYLNYLRDHRFLGELREVVVVGADDSFWDFSQYLHPRQDANLSGHQILSLGILHETVSRWVPPTKRVMAQAKIFEPERPIENSSEMAEVTVPDNLHVMTQLEGGARGLYHFSGVALFGPGHHIHLYGSEGTIKIRFETKPEYREIVQCGRIGDQSMKTLDLPEEQLGGWNGEADFIAAIRGEKPVTLNDFDTALQYMEFVEAVHESYTQEKAIDLPLP